MSKASESKEVDEGFCKKIAKEYSREKLQRPVYVIQEHHAKKLHWDLRFEFADKNKKYVLRSWALPKRPPTKTGDKRLAIAVDDHPLEYALFEGEIPEGGYGAGKVKIWDSGTFELESSSSQKIIVNINGKKLKGRYVLLSFGPKEKSWLFFKAKQ